MQRVAGNLGVMPVDGEGDGRVAQHAEVEGVVRVLPDVFAAEDHVFAEGLLQAGMKLVAEARAQGVLKHPECNEQRRKHGVGASLAGEHQVFVERRFQRARVGDASTVPEGLML